MVFPGAADPDPIMEKELRRLIGLGLRTLLLPHSDEQLTGADVSDHRLPGALNPVVLVTFAEKIRPDAAETVTYFREQGVALRVISGDNHQTIATIARQVGIQFEGTGYDARDLPDDLGEISGILETHSVFGRVTPAQKRQMVQAL